MARTAPLPPGSTPPDVAAQIAAAFVPLSKSIDKLIHSNADPEKKKKALTAELSNGRLAMMAIIGMFFQEN